MKLVRNSDGLKFSIEHEVLLDQKDFIKAVKESDIHDDANHNINPDEEDDHVDLDDEAELEEYEKQ